MQDVADLAGVSRALVSLVMNDSPQVSNSKREAVLQAAEELGYRPNLMARSLAQRRTSTVGVLVDDLRNPFFGEMVEGIETAAEKYGFQVLILNGHRDARRERSAVETLLQFQVEALALVGSRLDDTEIARAGRTVPTVVVAAGDSLPEVDTVVTDGGRGAALAVQHLIDLGHQRIVHVDGGANVSAPERRAGYREAMKAAGLNKHIEIVAGGDDEEDAIGAVEAIRAADHPPSAIFAFNDMLAAGLLDRLHSAGISVPADMSLVGFDNTQVARLGRISLTTIHQPRQSMGTLAVEALLARMGHPTPQDPIRHTLTPRLVVRSTTGPVPSVVGLSPT